MTYEIALLKHLNLHVRQVVHFHREIPDHLSHPARTVYALNYELEYDYEFYLTYLRTCRTNRPLNTRVPISSLQN